MSLYFTYIKTLIRSRTLILWTLLFPLVLSILFYFAFGNLLENESFHAIQTGVVINDNLKEEAGFRELLQSLSKDSEEQERVIRLHDYSSEKEAEKALKDGQIEGYYIMKAQEGSFVDLVVSSSGVSQTILNEVAKEYFQGVSSVKHLQEYYLEKFAVQNPAEAGMYAQAAASQYEEVADGDTHFKDISSDRTDFTIIYFYTLIGMLCMYGASFGIYAATETEANLSRRAARVSVSPVRKWKIFLAAVLAGYTMLYLENVLVILFMDRVLGVAFGDQLGMILLLSAAGCFAGVSFGSFVGSCSRKSAEFKEGLSVGLTMALCFLGGMMYQDMRYIIKEHVPVLDWVNPVTMITDGLYSLYCYSDYDLLRNSFFRLIIFGGLFLMAAVFCMRKKKYDSI